MGSRVMPLLARFALLGTSMLISLLAGELIIRLSMPLVGAHAKLLSEHDGYRMNVLQRTPDGYEVVSESGSRGRLRFEGEDLILEWDDRDAYTPERRLTSVPPDFGKLRDQWKAETGTSVEDFFKEP